tara:strand:- start:15571 stop:16257 length:687 start_codon:yes stop_codon:yes gene_type:complete
MKKKIIASIISCAALVSTGCSTLDDLGHRDNTLTGETERNSLSEGIALGAALGAAATATVATHGATIAYGAIVGTGVFGYLGLENDLTDNEVKAQLDLLGISVEDALRETRISFQQDVTFDLQKTDIKNEFLPTLNGIKMVIEELEGKATIAVVGHADYTGPDELNNYLSERRAEVIAEYLVDEGVEPDMILDYYGVSDSEPKDYCLNLECMRRIEIVIYKDTILTEL